MVRVLIECETVYAEEVKMIMDGASVAEVKKALQLRYEGKKDSGEQSSVSAESNAQSTQNEQADVQNPDQTAKENSDDMPQTADDKSLGE